MWTVEEGIARLREGGAKITSQRIAILRLLKGRTDHPSADQIYGELRQDFPTISYATIYSTAQLLADSGLLQILSIDDKRVHFDPNPQPHGHFRCQACGALTDFPIADNVLHSIRDGAPEGAHSVQIFLYGLCDTCRQENEKESLSPLLTEMECVEV
ncbi:MAG: transcriptional repressor [Synergistaceae bacterium]|nr:transcriptional repressor [Synergistaceae bacterium]